jgi:hypothetical protein
VEVVKKLKRAITSEGMGMNNIPVCAVEPGAVNNAMPLQLMREEISLLKSIDANMKEQTRVLTRHLGSGGAIIRKVEPERKQLV